MQPPTSNADAHVAKIAGRQHGQVDQTSLRKAGLSRQAIRTREGRGQLFKVHRGVYSVGHPARTTKSKYMAAVLGAGKNARTSGLAAAHLLSLISGPPPPPEVTGNCQRRLDGVTFHRSRLIGSRHTTHVDNIPCSNVAVALIEIVSRLDDVELSRAVHKATVKQVTEGTIRAALSDRPNAPGRGRLERMVFGDGALLLSELERSFLDLIREAGLPLPATNQVADGRLVDCRWARQGLTVELLGYRFHNSRASWERDHARRREARARGDAFRTFTYDDLHTEAVATIEEIRTLLLGIGR